jgi:hypothetical protein
MMARRTGGSRIGDDGGRESGLGGILARLFS